MKKMRFTRTRLNSARLDSNKWVNAKPEILVSLRYIHFLSFEYIRHVHMCVRGYVYLRYVQHKRQRVLLIVLHNISMYIR